MEPVLRCDILDMWTLNVRKKRLSGGGGEDPGLASRRISVTFGSHANPRHAVIVCYSGLPTSTHRTKENVKCLRIVLYREWLASGVSQTQSTDRQRLQSLRKVEVEPRKVFLVEWSIERGEL